MKKQSITLISAGKVMFKFDNVDRITVDREDRDIGFRILDRFQDRTEILDEGKSYNWKGEYLVETEYSKDTDETKDQGGMG